MHEITIMFLGQQHLLIRHLTTTLSILFIPLRTAFSPQFTHRGIRQYSATFRSLKPIQTLFLTTFSIILFLHE
jgi:hypothetical protein